MAIRPIPVLHRALHDVQGSAGRHGFGVTLNGILGPPIDVRATTLLVVNGRMYLLPIYVPRPILTNFLRCNVSTIGTAGAVARMGIYKGAQSDPLPFGVGLGVPDRLVADAGTVSTETTNERTIAIAQILAEGLYWLAVVGQGAPATQATLRATAAGVANPLISQVTAIGTIPGASLDGVTGALPDNVGELVSPNAGQIAAATLQVDEFL